MSQIFLITDDPARSANLARDLGSVDIHDLYADGIPSGIRGALMCDIADLGSEAIRRLRRLLAVKPQDAPFIMLLRENTPRARMQAVALGASQTVDLPFDLQRIRGALEGPQTSTPLAERARRQAEAVRTFYGTVFVADRPVTPAIIDHGTELVGQAIRETGIRDWIRAVRQFDDATHQHCLIVAGLAAAFAGTLGLGGAERHRLTRAALLHDVGKIHVPTAILNKPGRLDEAELALMRLHPAQGEAMLAHQGFEPEMLAVVRSHHEMLDGSGYPDGLRAGTIPDLVRLVTVCDIYGALVERRSYKPPMAGAQAYAILQDMVGRLDATLVSVFRPVAAAFDPCLSMDD